jgi:hypothetical protein
VAEHVPVGRFDQVEELVVRNSPYLDTNSVAR